MSKVIYILEDEFTLRSMISAYLADHGYKVYEYSDPLHCPLSKESVCSGGKKETCADYLITDIKMPGMSGLEFVELLRKNGCKVKDIAVMSAFWSEDDYQKARDLGCKTFDKPFNLVELFHWLKRCENTTPIISLPNENHLNDFNVS